MFCERCGKEVRESTGGGFGARYCETCLRNGYVPARIVFSEEVANCPHCNGTGKVVQAYIVRDDVNAAGVGP